MSWHANAVLIHADYKGKYEELLTHLGFTGVDEADEIDFDEASSSSNDGVAVATVDGWTVLWGGMAMFSVNLSEVSKKADAFELILEGCSGTAGFTWHSKGKIVREFLAQVGENIKDEGEPFPFEKDAFASDDHEQAVLEIMEKLTPSLERQSKATYTLFDVDA